MARRGKELEQLTELLERMLSQSDSFSLRSPAFLPDKLTGEQRELDVLLTYKEGHHTILTSFECKDWKTKVGTPVVKVSRKNVVIPASIAEFLFHKADFQTALKKADALGIRCFTLDQVHQFDWNEMSHLNAVKRVIDNIHFDVKFSEIFPTNTSIYFQDNILSEEIMRSIGLDVARQFPNLAHGIKHTIGISNIQDFSVLVDGEKKTAAQVFVSFDTKEETESLPLRFIEYKDTVENKLICQTMLTTGNFSQIPGNIAFVKKEGAEFMEVHFIPNKAKN